MWKVDALTSPEAMSRLLGLIQFESPILDTTYGSGVFWKNSPYKVIGCDINPDRAKDICCNFLHLPFNDNAYDVVVYDPPFHPFVNSREEERFSGMGKNEKELKSLFIQGLAECSRVSRNFTIVKCQDYIHNHKPQWMPLWAVETLGEPYEWLIATRPSKVMSSKWVNVRSLRRNHADYLMFNKQGNHR
jgi:hypothetical protein